METFEPFVLFYDLHESVKNCKPNDRSSLDRHFAIVLTDLEKLIAYYKTYCLQEEAKPDESKHLRLD